MTTTRGDKYLWTTTANIFIRFVTSLMSFRQEEEGGGRNDRPFVMANDILIPLLLPRHTLRHRIIFPLPELFFYCCLSSSSLNDKYRQKKERKKEPSVTWRPGELFPRHSRGRPHLII